MFFWILVVHVSSITLWCTQLCTDIVLGVLIPQGYSSNVMLQLPVKRLLQHASINQVLHN